MRLIGLVVIGFLLAGCNLSTSEKPTTVPETLSAHEITVSPATRTATPSPTRTPAITNTPARITQTPVPATSTPVMVPQTPISPTPPSARVCATCGGLRLRDIPGSGGNVITMLRAEMLLTIIGRTADNLWLEVMTSDGAKGWVAAEYLNITSDLSQVKVTGDVVAVPTAVAMSSNSVVSGVSSNARTIFLDGLAKGNLPHSFTRVGDSITAAPQFLTQIGSGNYQLGDYGYLADAISFFSGPNGRGANPFLASSLAARNGWGTTSILDPSNADPNVCRPGETPLECEYRLVKPSVALIMVGTNDSGGLDIGTFQANLQIMVETSISMGVIPVLSTIPPKHYNPATDGRVAEFNQVIIATARGYDIPLWDYGLTMRNMSGEGLALDGVHPSSPPDGGNTIFDEEHLQYGFPVRNLTALQVLDALWRYVLYDADQAVAATAPPSSAVNIDVPSAGSNSCSGAAMIGLTVGGQGRVTPGLPNKVRLSPSLSAEQIGHIPGEGVFSVIDGPQCADGLNWWRVTYEGLTGWTADGKTGDPWVEPYP